MMVSTITAISGLPVGSIIIQGNTFHDTTNNSSVKEYVNDEVVRTLPVTITDETCYGGSSGSLLCTRLVPLTASGGNRAYNAGSWTCSSASCSIVRITVMVESGATDQLYVGWTNSPTTASGNQLLSYRTVPVNGGTLIAQGNGSGSYINTGTDVQGLVPVNATVKAVYAHNHTTANIGAILYEYRKYYRP